ncbi:hypothetical protein C8P66_104145 [Humitalea rosea]|uniref:Uncharacterized protein n=1 Tax=Humitalea rosea TaxID=990373 RepID=A0A2W7JB28_9PROT|nr:hypothetical protein [Humitalea rosea]PZW48728.1 hypothetical protein C8P66_104145 [Humitalea rosea]
MKAFISGLVVAVVIAVGASVVLQGEVQRPVDVAFATSGVRL